MLEGDGKSHRIARFFELRVLILVIKRNGGVDGDVGLSVAAVGTGEYSRVGEEGAVGRSGGETVFLFGLHGKITTITANLLPQSYKRQYQQKPPWPVPCQ